MLTLDPGLHTTRNTDAFLTYTILGSKANSTESMLLMVVLTPDEATGLSMPAVCHQARYLLHENYIED